jgi:hypothetical protein
MKLLNMKIIINLRYPISNKCNYNKIFETMKKIFETMKKIFETMKKIFETMQKKI